MSLAPQERDGQLESGIRSAADFLHHPDSFETPRIEPGDLELLRVAGAICESVSEMGESYVWATVDESGGEHPQACSKSCKPPHQPSLRLPFRARD